MDKTHTPVPAQRRAQNFRAQADKHQTRFRDIVGGVRQLEMGGVKDQSIRKFAARKKFQSLVKTVVNRNRELKALGETVATADVSTPHDGSHLWSGDARDSRGNTTASAMATAQSIASRTGGRTVEQTPGGHALDQYAGPDSFRYLQERFKYLNPTDERAPHTARADLIEKGVQRGGSSVGEIMRHTAFDSPRNPDRRPMAEPGSAAGALWNVISARFARESTGDVTSVHAAQSDSPYFSSSGYQESTFKKIEEPIIKAGGKARVVERFGEDLTSDLRQQKRVQRSEQWKGTHGFRDPHLDEHGATATRYEIFKNTPRAKL